MGHFTLYRATGVYDLFWMLPWQFAYSAGVFSRWHFFGLTFYFFHYVQYNWQYCNSISEFPLKLHRIRGTCSHLYWIFLTVNLTAAVRHTLCSSTIGGKIKAGALFFYFMHRSRSDSHIGAFAAPHLLRSFDFHEGHCFLNQTCRVCAPPICDLDPPAASSDHLIVILSHTCLRHRAAQTPVGA